MSYKNVGVDGVSEAISGRGKSIGKICGYFVVGPEAQTDLSLWFKERKL